MIRKARERMKFKYNGRLCFLDKIIHISDNNPGIISDDDLVHQLITLYLAVGVMFTHLFWPEVWNFAERRHYSRDYIFCLSVFRNVPRISGKNTLKVQPEHKIPPAFRNERTKK